VDVTIDYYMQASSFNASQRCSGYNKQSNAVNGSIVAPDAAYRDGLNATLEGEYQWPLSGVRKFVSSGCEMPSAALVNNTRLPPRKRLQRRQRVVANMCFPFSISSNDEGLKSSLDALLKFLRTAYNTTLQGNITELGANGTWKPRVINYFGGNDSVCVEGYNKTKCALGPFDPASYPNS
jgi:hypothetical protein